MKNPRHRRFTDRLPRSIRKLFRRVHVASSPAPPPPVQEQDGCASELERVLRRALREARDREQREGRHEPL